VRVIVHSFEHRWHNKLRAVPFQGNWTRAAWQAFITGIDRPTTGRLFGLN